MQSRCTQQPDYAVPHLTRKVPEAPELGTPYYNRQDCWSQWCLLYKLEGFHCTTFNGQSNQDQATKMECFKLREESKCP